MNVTVLAVGKVKEPLSAPVAEFEGRARRYWRLTVKELASGGGRGRSVAPDVVREAEGRRILGRVPDGAELVALTRRGQPWSSVELARYLDRLTVRAAPGVAFVIGGAFGLDEAVLARATRKLSLSTLTLPHELARLVLAEQLYRAGTIIRREPYHKGPV